MDNQENESYHWKEHIRKRPTMYVGDVGMNGFIQMLSYLFEELIEGAPSPPVFQLELLTDDTITLKATHTDAGAFCSSLEELANTEVVPMTRIGIATILAVSVDILITVNIRPSMICFFERDGRYQMPATSSREKENSIVISFKPDKEIFKNLKLVYAHLIPFLQEFTFLNPTLKIIYIDQHSEHQRNVFHFPAGIFEEADYLIAKQQFGRTLFRHDIHTTIGAYTYRIAIYCGDTRLGQSFVKTYAGNEETGLGGSLEDGILDGIVMSVKRIAKKDNVQVVINRNTVKRELIVVAQVKGEDFEYAGCTKHRLNMPELRSDVKKLVTRELEAYFQSNLNMTTAVLKKFKQYNL